MSIINIWLKIKFNFKSIRNMVDIYNTGEPLKDDQCSPGCTKQTAAAFIFSTSSNLFNICDFNKQSLKFIATFVSRTQTIGTGVKTGAKYTNHHD